MLKVLDRSACAVVKWRYNKEKRGIFMPTARSFKIETKHPDLSLKVAKGHFSTNHSHTNYYIDLTLQKASLAEASVVARKLAAHYQNTTPVDTVLCLDGTEVIGTCLADELTKSGFGNLNENKTIYVVSPEYTAGSHMMFRDNIAPMIEGKHVLILAASVNTGYTVKAAIEAVGYYGGATVGIASIFATTEECMGIPVNSVFDPNDLDGYMMSPSHECPMCKRGERIDALVNSFGFSKL